MSLKMEYFDNNGLMCKKDQPPGLVETNSGPIQGVLSKAIFGQNYWSFEGIPYAQPPIGELRFKSPKPVQPWTEVLDASKQGPACWSFDPLLQEALGDEDCLHLNVYVEKTAFEEKMDLPVIVFVFGGAFMFGSSSKSLYGADFFMTRPVVLVTFNYRNGAFGFLSLDDPTHQVPGNAGLKDQRLALRWIKQNIKFFRGNPSNVTLMGESAGACSAHYHLLSQNSAGLFQRAILMSGCVLNPSATVDRKLAMAERLALQLEWTHDAEENILEYLQNVPAEDIAREQTHLLSDEEKSKLILSPFGPVVESVGGDDCVVSSSPLAMCQDDNCWSTVAQVPVLVLFTSEEGLYLRNSYTRRYIEDAVDYVTNLIPTGLASLEMQLPKRVADRLKSVYFKTRAMLLKNDMPFVNFITDSWILHGLYRTVKGRIERNQGATFVLRFNVDLGPLNHFKTLLCGEGIKGTCHADNCAYLFRDEITKRIACKSEQRKFIIQLIDIMCSFAELGKPEAQLNDNVPIYWPPARKNGNAPLQCLNVTEKYAKLLSIPEHARMQIWDTFYDKKFLF